MSLAPIKPPHAVEAFDRAPDSLAAGTPEPLRRKLVERFGAAQVLSRPLDLIAYASDASPYRLFPKAVVIARDGDDVAAAMSLAREEGVPLTFRSGGTSLNGQAQSEGILLDTRRHWRGLEILEDGAAVRVKPGNVLGHVNAALEPYGRKVGPDPASTNAATIGGVIANNSGGMRCGVVHDSYQTVRSLTFVLPSGTVIDSAAPDAAELFASAEPALAAGLAEIRDEIRADGELCERIRRKFEIKNTMGYRLCAFLDADQPVEIFRRLLVGSEGTLGFVTEAIFNTVPLGRQTTTALLFFGDVDAAADPVPDFVAAGATATELMGATTLIAAAWNLAGTPERWKELPPESAALLVEFRADTDDELERLIGAGMEVLSGRELIDPPEFTRDDEVTAMRWRVREGMFGLIGAIREPGTALISEDICVPPRRVAEAVRDIRELLAKHGFLPGVAGHASAGNLHFMLTPRFDKEGEHERYDAFMGELVELICEKYDGSLKSEHGTGFNMAPYLEREWGSKATDLMWRIKELADPDGVLSPGVILNRDPRVHLANLKTTPEIDELATKCTECGFCEPVCPSRDVTMTPRQRIVALRELARQPEGSPLISSLLDDFDYDGMQTCAADSSCLLPCPVGIDTGKLVKQMRAATRSRGANRRATSLARHWGAVERAARAGLRVGGVAGGRVGTVGSALARAALDEDLIPSWPAAMPGPAGLMPATERQAAAAVYLPACVNRIFGPSRANGQMAVPDALVEVSARAGKQVWIPDDVAGHCCSVPWSSKGHRDGQELMAKRTAQALRRWSGEGELPVVICASSCALGLADDLPAALDEGERERYSQIEVIDGVDWCQQLLAELNPSAVGSLAVHPSCASRLSHSDRALRRLAEVLGDDVTTPVQATCCGMAGDRGMLHPELTASATALEAAELGDRDFDAHVSSNRTCELALESATGRVYESVIQLLERQTRPDQG